MTATARPLLQQLPITKPQPNRRILVVEDEPAIASAYHDILVGETPANVLSLKRSSRQLTPPVAQPVSSTAGAEEFQLTVVNTAGQALAEVQSAVAKGQPFAMGFFDVLLGPGMDGIELAQKIFELDSQMIAVFVTAYSDRTVQSIQGLLGADQSSRWDYLNKPFSHGEILQKARAAVALWNLKVEKESKDQQVQDMQQRLMESERMASVAAVSRGVSHEFGNLLTQILGKAELYRARPEAEMREALEQILKASTRAAEILDRFKDLAKPTSQKSHKQWVHLHQIVDEALQLLSHQLNTHGIKVCRLKTDRVAVLADSTALLQVLVNLLINSMHAMPHSGQLDISVVEADSFGEIKLRDYGNGVDPKVLPHVTEPFFTTKGNKGTGLGLSISKEIVEIEHRGEFVLRNHEVKGFEVTIRLPLTPESEEDHE